MTETGTGAPRPRVELLWWSGCPSTPRALSELRTVLGEAGLDPGAVEVRQIETDEQALKEAFAGSPTVRIDGRDVEESSGERPGLTCRVYRLRDGRASPTPDTEDLRAALQAGYRRGRLRVGDLLPTALQVGDRAPDFELPDTEGGQQRLFLPEGAPAQVVVFTCNHCPYALAWHDRLMAAARDYAGRGVRFVAVNPNDADRYPADSYASMQARVRAEEWPVPYLRDESQEAARAFGARTTPDVFVLDPEGRLRYRGAPDSDYSDSEQNAAWLREALDDLLAEREVRRDETEPVGCSVKWRRD